MITDLGGLAPLDSIAGATQCTDADGDGYCSIATGGNDCNDASATAYPGAPEQCDGIDNDCDGTIDEGCPTGSISLSTRAYKVKGKQRVDLTWSGATTTNVDVYRNGVNVSATANDGVHTDTPGGKGGGTYTYQICESGTSTCSNTSAATF